MFYAFCRLLTFPADSTRDGYVFTSWLYGAEQVFEGNWSIFQDVTLVAKWKKIYTYRKTEDQNGIEILSYNQVEKIIEVPSKIEGLPVTSIASQAFAIINTLKK